MSGIEDTNAAATLSLEIDTGGAEFKLKALTESYGLFTAALNNVAEARGLKVVGQDSEATKARIKELELQLIEAATAYKTLKSAGTEMAKGITTSMSAASSSIKASLKLPEETLAELNARMKSAGEAAAAALASGLTTSNYNVTRGLLTDYEKGTVASLERVKAILAKAQAYLQTWKAENAKIRFGDLAFDADFAAAVESKLEAVKAVYAKSSIELIRIQEQEAEAIRASQIRSSVERIRVEEQLAEQERAAVLASRMRSSVELVRIQEQEAEAIRASQIRSSVERIRVEEQLAEEERRQMASDAEKKLRLERQYILASEQQRLKAAIDARKLMDAGYAGNLSTEFAPSVLTTANGFSLASLNAQYAALTPAVNSATGAQQKWNSANSESHALARGLSGSLGQLWMTYGMIAPLLAGAALGAGFKNAMEKGAEFEYQLTFVKALGGESAEAVSKLSAAALELGSTSMKGPVELASGLRVLAQAGLNAKEAILALPAAADLAIVGEMSMEQAAVTLVGVMEAFKIKISEIGRVGDVFAKAAAVSQTSVTGMTEAMKTASVVGTQYGVSMEDAATAITLLAKVNIHGTAAGTSLRNMLKEIYTPGKQAADVMKALGVSAVNGQGNLKQMADVIYDLKDKLVQYNKSSQVNILQKLFGERGAKEAIQMLSLARKEWEGLRNDIANSTGFMGRVTAELESTTKGVFAQAKNALEVSLIGAFEKTDGAAKELATSLRDLFSSEKFRNDVGALVEAMSGLATVLVKVAPLLLYVAEGWAAWKTIGVISAGIVSITGAVSKLVGAAEFLVTTFGAGAVATGALEAAMVALLSPTAAVVAVLGAIYLAFKTWNDMTPDVIRSTENFNLALDRQIEKLRSQNKELAEQIRLKKTGTEVDADAAAKQKASLESAIAKMRADLASDKVGRFEKIKIEGDLGRAVADLNTLNSKVETAMTEQRELMRSRLTAYQDDMLEQIRQLEVRASKAKDKVDAATVNTLSVKLKGMLKGLRSDMKQTELNDAKNDISSLMQEMSITVSGTGRKKFDMPDSDHAKMLGAIADIETQRKIEEEAIRHSDAMIAIKVKAHQISELEAADLKDANALLRAQTRLKYELLELDRMKGVKTSPKERATQEGKVEEAKSILAEVTADSDARVQAAHAELMRDLDNQEAQLLGKRKNYLEQYEEQWRLHNGKKIDYYAKLLAEGDYDGASTKAAQLAIARAYLERASALYKVGVATSKLKDLTTGADADIVELQAKFAEIDDRFGDGVLIGLGKDIEKSALLNEKLVELKSAVEQLKIDPDNKAARADSARLQKSIESLTKDAHKGAKELFKDIEGGLSKALEAGFENGYNFSSKKFIESVKAQLKAASLKLVVQAIVNPVMGQVGSSMMSMLGLGGSSGASGGSGLMSLGSSAFNYMNTGIAGGSSLYGSFATSSIGQSLGLSQMTGGYTQAAMQFGNLTMPATEITGTAELTSIGTSIGSAVSAISTAMPYIAAAYVIADAAGLFGKRGGPQQGQYGDISASGYKAAYTMSGGDSLGNQALAQSAYNQVASLYTLAGKQVSNLVIGQGYKLDPQGSASGVAYRNISIGGQTISGGTFDGNNGGQWYGANNDGTGAANFLGKLTSAEIKALTDAIGDSKLSETIKKLSANFADLADGLTKYLTAQAVQKSLLSAVMTESEKQAQTLSDAQAALNTTFASLQLAVPQTTSEFRALVEGLDLTTQAGQDTLNKLNLVSSAFVTVADNMLKTEQARAGWQMKLDILQGKYTQDQLDRFFQLVGTQDEATKSLMQHVWALEDQKVAAKAAGEAMSALASRLASVKSSAYSAYENLLQNSGDAAGAQNFALQAAQERYRVALSDIGAGAGISADQAQAYIDQRGGMANAARDYWNELSAADSDFAAGQKEKLTALVEAQNAVLQAQNAISAAAQQAASEAAKAQQDAANASANAQKQMIDGWQRTADAIMQTVRSLTDSLLDETQGFAAKQAEFAIATAQAKAGDQAAANRLPELAKSLVDLGKVNSVTAVDQALLTARTAATLRDVVSGIGTKFGIQVPAFAAGGSFGGGLRLVGENGPELEVTGPSRIFSAEQTRAMLGVDGQGQGAVLEELRGLRAENAALRNRMDVLMSKIEDNTRQASNALNGRGSAPMLVEVA